jgi:small-conductance mechanosensitive channel
MVKTLWGKYVLAAPRTGRGGPLLGEINRIGIRSSTVRTTQGAEVILPNSEMVSKELVNGTHSDRQRRYDIVTAYGARPIEVPPNPDAVG